MDYFLHLFILLAIYGLLALSLDLIAGHTGKVSIAHAAFCGLGAYVSGILGVQFGAPFLLNVLISVVAVSLLSLLISLPSLRLYDDYFVIATFGLQMVVFGVLNNWRAVTGGALGLRDIPPIDLRPLKIGTEMSTIVVCISMVVVGLVVVRLLTVGPFGRILHAVRENEVFARSLGKNTNAAKVRIFGVSAALAACSGAVYAHYIGFVDPTSFTIMESILIVSMVIIGGAGSMWGPVLGACVIILLQEGMRFVGLPTAVAANLRQVAYGVLLVVMVLFRPRGLIGKYGFGR